MASGTYRQSGEHSPCLWAQGGEFAAPIRSFCGFLKIFCTSPIGRVQIAGPIVFEEHKRNKRIGKAWTTVLSALPIVIEIAYYFRCTDRKWKYVQYKTAANYKFKIMSSATVPDQYPMIGAILDPS